MTALVDRSLDVGADPADDADLRIRKRTAVGTLLIVCVASVAYLLVGLANRPALLVLAAGSDGETRQRLACDPWLDTILTIQSIQRWSIWIGSLPA